MTQLITGLVLFLGAHSVSIVAPGWRDRVVARIGLRPWQGIYAVVAIVGFVLIVRGYGDVRNQTPYLYVLPRWINAVTSTLMLPVFPLLLAAYLPGGLKTAARHPMLVAVKLWAFAHLLANGSVADVVLFGSVLAWAVADRISLKRRPPRKTPGAPPGPWNDVIAIVGGLFLYALMIEWGHALLIGMPLVLR
jgi:uncharacterized membrane protein